MKKILAFLLLVLFISLHVSVPRCDAGTLYAYYVQLAHEALDAKKYNDALYYFDVAHSVDPDQKEPFYYINLIKRIQENRVEKVDAPQARRTVVRAKRQIVKSSIVDYSSRINQKTEKKVSEPVNVSPKPVLSKRDTRQIIARKANLSDSQALTITADVKNQGENEEPYSAENVLTVDAENQESLSSYLLKSEEKEEKPKYDPKEIRALEQDVIRSIRKKTINKESEDSLKAEVASAKKTETLLQEDIEMDEELWNLQPKTEIEIELEKFVLLRGKGIERFLILTPDLFSVERVDKDTLKISPSRIGTSLFHVWDEKGRWTFTLRSIFPLKFKMAKHQQEEDAKEQYVEPFTLSYSNSWGSSYLGDSMSELERTSLRYNQTVVLKGQTPYGDVDGFLGFVTFDGDTTLTRQGVGLSNGKIGDFKDFSIRGWDISKTFSALSLPGRSFRGALIESYAFNRKIHYTVLRGHDRARFEVISPGTTVIKKSYIEGARVSYLPDENTEYSVNYARGWGEERSDALKDRVISLESKNKIKDVYVHSEVGYDEDETAKLVSASYKKDNISVRLNVRDINKEYRTISSSPSGTGEVGGELHFAWSKDKTRFSSVAEIYRDREFYNPDNENGVNFNWSANFYKPLTKTINWNAACYFNDTSQLLSPQTNFRLNNRVSKSYRMFKNHPFSLYAGHLYSLSRYDNAESSEYNRNELTAGVNVRLLNNLDYYWNYSYAWAEDVLNDEVSTPRVMDTGLNYSRSITKKVSGRMNLTYRNEENAEGNFSFLAGVDSLRGSVGLTYRPYKDIEVFLDASARNIWAENADQEAYNEADVRMGMTASFDTLFRWNPSCVVKGIVYRDMNADTLRNEGEPLLEGIKVNVGKKTVTTNAQGQYKAKVKARSVQVSVDPQSIPPGFVFSTAAVRDIEVVQGTEEIINFGLTTYSGIYGVVYLDKNQDGKLDSEDDFIPGTHIILDEQTNTYSGSDGVYSFNNIEHGRHVIRLDVNSLPRNYLPLIRIKSEVVVAEGTTYTFNIPLKRK